MFIHRENKKNFFAIKIIYNNLLLSYGKTNNAVVNISARSPRLKKIMSKKDHF